MIGTSIAIVLTLKPLKALMPNGFTKSFASSAAVCTGSGGRAPGIGSAFSTRRLTVSKTAPRSMAKVSARWPAKTRMPVAASVRIALRREVGVVGIVRGPMFDGTVGLELPAEEHACAGGTCRPFALESQPRSSVTR